MDQKIIVFQQLAKLFEEHGFNLYLVGGTVRDYLLGLSLTDLDAVSDATPEQILKFLKADDTFKRFGSLKYKTSDGVKFDITTLRIEKEYRDNRHPSEVVFIKDIAQDFVRRDFTINALYMDKNLKVYDYCHGQEDLNKRILRMIGEADQRIKEDPLRILRAIRFTLLFNLKIDDKLEKAMQNNIHLLSKITDAKIKSELAKIDEQKVNHIQKEKLFAQFAIANLLGVIK
ncbi:MAG: CCA tRNA nucleotidyltransferase, partial [Erysipelotrichaceae bacterium]|jgi:tRNA nucleotidyltransferase (CCA-adding enzyme)|nr:CCA tRNA nucleotidyltransferase [Erysipelotrichaceae bacterium]